MATLRKLSPRPRVVADVRNRSAGIGIAGPFGRERVVYALPFNVHGNNVIPGHQVTRPQVVVSSRPNYPADPNNTMVGVPGIWVPRMLVARWTEDTRRLGG